MAISLLLALLIIYLIIGFSFAYDNFKNSTSPSLRDCLYIMFLWGVILMKK